MRTVIFVLVLCTICCDGKLEKEMIKGRKILRAAHFMNLPVTLEKSPHKAILRTEPMNRTQFRTDNTQNQNKNESFETIKNNTDVDVFRIVISGYIKRGHHL